MTAIKAGDRFRHKDDGYGVKVTSVEDGKVYLLRDDQVDDTPFQRSLEGFERFFEKTVAKARRKAARAAKPKKAATK